MATLSTRAMTYIRYLLILLPLWSPWHSGDAVQVLHHLTVSCIVYSPVYPYSNSSVYLPFDLGLSASGRYKYFIGGSAQGHEACVDLHMRVGASPWLATVRSYCCHRRADGGSARSAAAHSWR